MKKIKKYTVDPSDSEVVAMSLVEEPAIESDFIYLSKDKPYIALESDYKHLVYGPALIPDKMIYRNDGVEEYYLTFSKEAIEKLSQDFLKRGYHDSFTVDHREEVGEVYITEQWIKMDEKLDKSVALGLDANLPIGTWFIGAKVNNNDVWESVKSGEFKGFSIESFLTLTEDTDNFSENEPTSTEEPITVTEPTQAEEPTVEVKESVLDKILNLITPSLSTKQAEEEPITVTEPTKEEEPVNEPSQEEEPKEEEKKVDEIYDNLKAEIEALKQEKEKLEEKIKELGKKPSKSPSNLNPKGNNGDTFTQWRATMKQMMNY